jgi:hypothetical protein
MHDMSVNVAGGATPGYLNDPGPTGLTSYLISDLQAIFSLFSKRGSCLSTVGSTGSGGTVADASNAQP